MVRKGGFEPPRLSAPPPQDGVSASSTTSALASCKTETGILIITNTIRSHRPQVTEEQQSAVAAMATVIQPRWQARLAVAWGGRNVQIGLRYSGCARPGSQERYPDLTSDSSDPCAFSNSGEVFPKWEL